MGARRRWWAKGSGSRRELEERAEDVLEGLDEYDLSKRPEVRIINRFLRFRTCIMLMLKAVGSLALLWSTVVLLGGFVTLLKKVDFWYLTFIGFVQAAGIFNALADEQFIFVTSWLLSPFSMLVSWIEELQKNMRLRLPGTSEEEEVSTSQVLQALIYVVLFVMLQIVKMILHVPVMLLHLAPLVCLVLSLIRLLGQDFVSAEGDYFSKKNLKPALNIFYSLAVAQAGLYQFWTNLETITPALTLHICNNYGYERGALNDYITETKRKCIKDTALADDWNLITYALSLLDSESPDPDDYCSGLRILHALIEEKVPVSQLLIRSSRQRIQKLIRTLGWRRPTDWETRELAARIMAHLASDLSLADFPGALAYIYSLLESHCYKKDQESLHFPWRKKQKRNRKKSVLEIMMEGQLSPSERYMLLHDEQGIKTSQGTTEELIIQGLRIVENLAHNERNCIEICKHRDLLLKITSTLSSDKLFEEVKTNGGCSVRVIDGTLKVVSRLIGVHGDVGKNMRQDIACNGNGGTSTENMTAAVSNLMAILGLKGNNNILGLQTRAIEILAQLLLDESLKLDTLEEKFIESLLQFFLPEEWMSKYLQEKQKKIKEEAKNCKVRNNINIIMWLLSPLLNEILLLLRFKARNKKHIEEQVKQKIEEAKEIASQLKVKSGEALALMSSMRSQSNSDVIMNFTECGDVKQCLTEMLDSKITTVKCTMSENEVQHIFIKIGCRISAAEILKHLCAHSTGDHSFHKTVLRKVLEELRINSTGTQNVIMGSTSACRRFDIENPQPPSSHPDEPQIPGSNKQQSDKRRFQAALLSLYAAIRATWTDAGDFARLLVELAGNDFAVNIEAIIKENSYATPACLAMLKIICEMVILLVQHGHYVVEDIRNKEIIDALSVSSKTMAGIEGCMLFAGMDVDSYGVPVKPLSSVLVEKARKLLNGENTRGGE